MSPAATIRNGSARGAAVVVVGADVVVVAATSGGGRSTVVPSRPHAPTATRSRAAAALLRGVGEGFGKGGVNEERLGDVADLEVCGHRQRQHGDELGGVATDDRT